MPPEDCADETIDRVARRLAGGERIRTGDPISYFRGVARNVWHELRKQDARKRSMIILSAADTRHTFRSALSAASPRCPPTEDNCWRPTT